MTWHKYKDEAPPYDTLVLIRDWQRIEQANWEGPVKYALAFNQNYPPDRYMTQVVETKTLVDYPEVPFEIYEWAIVE